MDSIVKLVSLHLFFACYPLIFLGKVALVRTFWPVNGGIIIEQHWVDENGNQESHQMATWVGFPPRGDTQV